jgi:hypothetical protein
MNSNTQATITDFFCHIPFPESTKVSSKSAAVKKIIFLHKFGKIDVPRSAASIVSPESSTIMLSQVVTNQAAEDNIQVKIIQEVAIPVLSLRIAAIFSIWKDSLG